MAEHENIGGALAAVQPESVEEPRQTGSVRTLVAIGAEIREHEARFEYHKRAQLWEAVEIGRRLTEAHDQTAYGEWEDFLARETGYSRKIANNFIRVFEAYGDRQIALFENNSEAVVNTYSHLSVSQALALLALPEGEREQFVTENDVESMTVREMKEAIRREREAREAAEQERDELNESYSNAISLSKELAKKADQARADAARADESAKILNNGLERERKAREEAERELSDAVQERDKAITDLDQEREEAEGTALRIAELEGKLEDAEARREDMAEKLEQAKADAAHAEQSRAEMERSMQTLQGLHDGTMAELDELRNKPVDVAVQTVRDEEAIEAAREEEREKLQAQYDQDMAALREQLAAAQSAPTPATAADKDMAAFEVIFNQVQGQINALLGLMLKIADRGDTRTAQGLRNALMTLSAKVAEAAQGKANEETAEAGTETEGATA